MAPTKLPAGGSADGLVGELMGLAHGRFHPYPLRQKGTHRGRKRVAAAVGVDSVNVE